MIVIFLACSGKALTLWTWPYLLVCVQRLTFSFQLRTWQNGFSKNSMIDTCIQQFQDWAIPLHPDKLEGPFTFLAVLGIELTSLLLQARLSQEKFDRIHTLLVSWSQKRHCTRKYDQSSLSFSQRGPSYKT